ncbi:MAG: filamentous hemagglutinin N-terminal domain-containing protein [Candidatus Melainabacteria bacterium]|nr:filamentous hemagglutinin N-terminal domain-containing protein [Candidatus Melainabacteria bacterium]
MKKAPQTALALLLATLSGIPAYALPAGYEVVSGNVSFNQVDANTLHVTSTSDLAVVKYNSFNVAQGETVQFFLPSSTASIYNHIVGPGASLIQGNVLSNGGLVLVNNSGIQLAQSANIQAASAVLSTLNLSYADYLKGQYKFTTDSKAAAASILNAGTVDTAKGGAVLVGSAIQNSGLVSANGGSVHLVVGDQVTVQISNNVVANITVNKALVKQVAALQHAIQNTGTLRANGGLVELQAQVSKQVFQSVVNHSGLIAADTLGNSIGSVRLVAKSTNSSALMNSTGTIQASGNGNQSGGNIQLNSEKLQLAGTVNAGGQGGMLTAAGSQSVEVSGPFTLTADNSSLLSDKNLTVAGPLDSVGTLNLSAGIKDKTNARLTVNGAISAKAGDVILRAGQMNLNNAIKTSGQVSIAANQGQAIKLATATNSTSGTTFDLSTQELAQISANRLSVGSDTLSGNVDVVGDLSLNPLGYHLNVESKSGITVKDALLDAGKHQLTFKTPGNISITNTVANKSVDVTSLNGKAITVETKGVSSAVTVREDVNGQSVAITTRGTNSGLKTLGTVNASAGSVSLLTTNTNSSLQAVGPVTASSNITLRTEGAQSQLVAGNSLQGAAITLETRGVGSGLKTQGTVNGTGTVTLATKGASEAPLEIQKSVTGQKVAISTSGKASHITLPANPQTITATNGVSIKASQSSVLVALPPKPLPTPPPSKPLSEQAVVKQASMMVSYSLQAPSTGTGVANSGGATGSSSVSNSYVISPSSGKSGNGQSGSGVGQSKSIEIKSNTVPTAQSVELKLSSNEP